MSAAPNFPFQQGPGLDPPTEYAEAHAMPEPLEVTLPGQRRAVLAVRYDDVRTVLADPRFSREAYPGSTMFARRPESLALVLSDPPVHTRRRRSVLAAFSARRVAQERPALVALARELVADLRTAGPVADLVDTFTVPFPLAVICDLLGVPAADRGLFRPWVNAMMSTSRHTPDEVATAHREMHAYFAELLDGTWAADAAGRAPTGLIAELGRPGPAERRLSRAEAVVMSSGLLMAGYETTSNQLAVCVYLLLRDRARWERLRAAPEEVPEAVEEMLRWTSFTSTGGIPHVATEEVPLSHGTVPAGGVVVPITDAANRDPDVFTRPDDIDLARASCPHLAFGHGRHYCLGADLARAELDIALTTLLRELPGLTLATPETEPDWRTGMFIRGIWQLPVRWGTTTGVN
jgi:cytochrome P450